MTGDDLREARLRKGWTQVDAAEFLGVSQGYVSLLEEGRRPVSSRLLRKVLRGFDVSPTSLPVVLPGSGSAKKKRDYAALLGALGYPGFAYLKGKADRNPATLLLEALAENDLDARVAEGLPWVALRYPDMKWDWLVQNAKLRDLQNRLGFVVTLARLVAERKAPQSVRVLADWEARLERSRLVREDTFCHESMTEAEKNWLRGARPAHAKHWNLLTDLAPEHLLCDL